MATRIRLVFHFIATFHHIVAGLLLISIDVRVPNNDALMRINDFSYLYFTVWTFVFQLIFLICALVCDIGEMKPEQLKMVWPKHTLLQQCTKIRDFMFHTLVFPSSGHTVIAFWAIFLYDREMILPAVVDQYIHPLLNHAVHSNIVPVMILEVFLGNIKYPRKNLWRRIFWLTAMITGYYVVLFATYFITGRWIYLFFDIFSSWSVRILHVGINYFSLYLMFFIGVHAEDLVLSYAMKKTHKENRSKPKQNDSTYIIYKQCQDILQRAISYLRIFKKMQSAN